jgi:hypothetical protein
MIGSAWTAFHAVFLVTLALAGGFYVLCYAAPRLMLRQMSMPWAFHLDRTIDLDFQSVLYAAYHTAPFARITHGALAVEQVAWLVVIQGWSLPVGAAALALLLVQAALLREPGISVVVAVAWGIVWVLAAAARGSLGDARAMPVAEIVLVAGGALRMVGHLSEPIPPMIGAVGDRFLPLAKARIGLRAPLLIVLGYVAEFSSGLPFRLFVVQVGWIAQRLGVRPARAMTWPEAAQRAREVHTLGWRAFRPMADLIARSAPPPREERTVTRRRVA